MSGNICKHLINGTEWVEFLQADNSRAVIRTDMIYCIEERLGSKTQPTGTTEIHYNDISGYETHYMIVKSSYNDVLAALGFIVEEKEQAK